MALYKEKFMQVDAITFEDFLGRGLCFSDADIANSGSWEFSYRGDFVWIRIKRDINEYEYEFRRGDMLIVNQFGSVSVLSVADFEKIYEPLSTQVPIDDEILRVTPAVEPEKLGEATYAYQRQDEFEKELTALLNRYSLEGGSNTPDFALAQYLIACLKGFNAAVSGRAKFWSSKGVVKEDSIKDLARQHEPR